MVLQRDTGTLKDDHFYNIGAYLNSGDLEDLERVVERTVAEFGAIDVVVNNAATALAGCLASQRS